MRRVVRKRRQPTRRRLRTRVRKTRKQQGGDEPGTVVIVEPRKHKALRFLLKNLLENLGPNWSILLRHGTRNKEWAEALIQKEFPNDTNRITLSDSGKENMTQVDYSLYMKTKEFWKDIPTDLILIAQTDSMICPPHRGLLNRFTGYDYVGAPWTSRELGNGGFSIRRKKAMMKILETCPDEPVHEDVLFARGCPGARPFLPSFEEARAFSIEGIYHPKSFGIHKPWANPIPIRSEKMEAQCPGIKELESLQGVEEN
jgi:hypothetical protein